MKRRLACLLLLTVAACSNGPGGGSPYERGIAALDKGDARTARVELLNAIKADPNDSNARIAQARAYLALSDGAAAEAELARVRRLGAPVEAVAHLLGHALLLKDNPRGALEALDHAAPEHAAFAARIRAEALHKLGDGAAGAAFDEAVALAPRDAELWTALARYRRDNGDFAGALAAADKGLEFNPRAPRALVLRGELTRSQYGLAAAIPWFDRAVEIDPADSAALLERAATYGDMGRMRDMLADTRAVLAASPANPRAFYLQAMLAARAGKFDVARTLYQRTKGRFADQPSAILLVSALDFQSGNFEQAGKRLERLLEAQPGNRRARRLLAASYWRRGDAVATIAAIRPIANLPDADSYALTLMGRALEKAGEPGPASVYLARAARPQSRSATALAEPVGGETLDRLRREAARDPTAPAQIALIRALLGNGIGGEALERAVRLQSANPGAPDAHILAGDARGMTGDFRGAAEDYRKAANLAFNEPVAMRMIEALERSGQSAAAGRVLDLFLQQNPGNVPALLLAGGRTMAAEDWPRAIRIYESLRARLGNRDAVMLNNLAWAYSETGEVERALPLARRAWSLDKDNPATADTYGWLLIKSGADTALGLALLERAARGAPSDEDIRKRLETARRG